MKKRYIVTAVMAAATATLIFAACQQSEYGTIKRAFGYIKDAVRAEKLIEVTSDGMLLSSVQEIYTESGAGYKLTTTTVTLNPIGDPEGMYDSTVVGPEECFAISVGKFPEESMLENIVYNGEWEALSMTAILSSEFLVSLGFKAEDCIGDATIAASLSEGYFESLEITYLSSNGNEVSISLVFEY